MFKRCFLILAAICLFSPFAFAADIALPHEFTAGEPAKASEVNENLQVLLDAINSLQSRVDNLEKEVLAFYKVVFVKDSDIWTMRSDGSNLTKLTETGTASAPSWSPDGTRIIYTDSAAGNRDIYIMDQDGENKVQLTSADNDEFNACMSPDGATIAYIYEYNGNNRRLWTMAADGSSQQEVLAPVTLNATYDTITFTNGWSTDGTYLLIQTSAPSANYKDLWSVNMSNVSDVLRLTDASGGTGGLMESSGLDSWYENTIVFNSRSLSGTTLPIVRMDSDGSNMEVLASENNVFYNNPTWSSNGAKICFSSDATGVSELYIMNPDGGEIQQITSFGGNGASRPDIY
ncbi:WD40 domain protein beta Propeller [Desulfatibacillum aliphaticivorans]|uniref:WD40 domain protein beta Propeller n=1 Tax=Desulfatibacillum aliphaticivorans TaxID=218208 RepID=B8FGE0_DESAL|nr:PD40 domain-containing protein [Desulfatibacillum aliphaticivorans]ACL03820.1 WD40 domain protein beta Propeller [Desulfatibacillum aliphaticivorans]